MVVFTCNTEAPAWRNCSPVSAESIPPVARIGKPGIARAMADTALRAMGLMALPAYMDTRANILVFNDKTDYTEDTLRHATILKKQMLHKKLASYIKFRVAANVLLVC